MRLTENERAVAEVAALAEHSASLTAVAAAFQLEPDVPVATGAEGRTPLIHPLDEARAGESASILAEIREWVREALGIGHVPSVWRALANNPRMLEATWRKDQLVLAGGALDGMVKGCAALAVAQFRQSSYWIAYWTQYLRERHALQDAALVEIAGAVMHYVSFNTIAHGMRLEAGFSGLKAADVAPGGQYEHMLPGAKKPPARGR